MMPPQPPPPDEALLQRARNGCRESFAGLYTRHQARVFRFALRMTGSRDGADEITQEVFLSLIEKPAGFDGSRGAFVPYLLGVARHMALRRFRTERPMASLDTEREPVADPGEGDPFAAMSRKQVREELDRVITNLPVVYREVLILCDLEEMDYADAARTLGIPIGTVRSRLNRARGLLLARSKAGFEQPSAVRCKP